jgi:hypothetical protein
MIVFQKIFIRGFGVVLVIGLSLEPSQAAKIIAFIFIFLLNIYLEYNIYFKK